MLMETVTGQRLPMQPPAKTVHPPLAALVLLVFKIITGKVSCFNLHRIEDGFPSTNLSHNGGDSQERFFVTCHTAEVTS